MTRSKTILFWVIGFFVVFTVVGFFVVPPLLKSVILRNLSDSLHREVSIRQVKVNPYALSVTIKGFALRDRETEDIFFSFDELFARFKAISIFKRAIIVGDATLKGPHGHVVRNEDGSYNFSDLLAMAESRESKPAESSKPIQFSINNIIVSGGSLGFIDLPKDTFHEVEGLTLKIPFISNMRYYVDTYVEPSFSALINGDAYSIEGKTKPFAESRESEFTIDIKDFDFTRYLPYVPVKMGFRVLSGVIDLTGKVTFVQHKNKPPSLIAGGNIHFRNIDVVDGKKTPLVKLSSAEIDLTSYEVYANSIRVAKADFQSPEVAVRRSRKGTINLLSLFPEKKAVAKKTQVKKPPAPAKTEDTKPLALAIDALQVVEGKVLFEDFQPPDPVKLQAQKLNIQVENMSLDKNSKANMQLSFALNKRGVFSTKGTLGIDPLSLNLVLDAKGIGIKGLQPYFAEKIRLYIAGGDVSTSGNLAVQDHGDKGLTARYTGKVLVTNFSSLDKNTAEDFAKWRTLAMGPLDIGYNPTYAHIKGVALSDFYSAVVINPDGTLSFSQIQEEPAGESHEAAAQGTKAPAPRETKTEPPLDIEIGKVTLQGGTIQFTDRLIKPNYSAALTEIGGRVTGLSPRKNRHADVELRGKLDNYVPLEITGKINPWKENLYVDLAMKFKDLELSPLTPYSGKYVGYSLEKGKLSFDVQYLVVDKKLDAKNVIFFDQLILGDRVESSDAVKLPVKLAIALLKDRHGQIKLDIPVTGYIDDPKFSIWKIIWKIIGNLLTKAATSPFALLGSMFGSGEELGYLEFDYGQASLNEANIKKLDMLTNALEQRPSLKLDIEGHADPERDREGLKSYLVNRKVKTQKLKDMMKKGSPSVPADEITMEPAEYEKYLKRAYDAEKFPKPRNIIGLAKSLPVGEMEKLMFTNTMVNDNDLRMLANQRATNAKELILKSGKVTPDRVFVVEPKSLAPEKKGDIKDSRVDFRLK
ncbi:MAG: AsmA family protein [Syntrophorhabdus sp. PtaU1.Bin050]|nr:MAG: AsmA family protein [Syntrophorhabdus sp. PtaU1.Bin050]